MKKAFSFSLIFALQIVCMNFLFAGSKSDTIKSNNIEYQKFCFYSAKQEIEDMLSGKKPLDYERAVFVMENAYLGNSESYVMFKTILDFHINNIEKLFIENFHPEKQNFKQTMLETEEVKKEKYRQIIANMAIFTYITDTTAFQFGNTLLIHTPFVYSFKDPFGTNSWQNSQVFNLLNRKTKQGNCYALASLYKIFSERLKTDANISIAPNHIFIQHKDNKGIQYNVELATKAFPGTGNLQTITYTTNEAIRNGIALRTLDTKQSIVLCLVYLAKSYENKFNIKGDDFSRNCANAALKNDSLNLNAMLLKAEVLEERIIRKNKTIAQLQGNKEFQQYQKFIAKLYQLGYREMPLEMKNILISTIRQDTVPLIIQDHTPQPFAGIGVKSTRYATLSNGVFEEVHTTKPIEKFNRTVFDTKTKKIKSFENIDMLYNNYNFDPVVFALSVDPLAGKYPHMSPYATFENNPTYFNDPTGKDAEYTVQGNTITFTTKIYVIGDKATDQQTKSMQTQIMQNGAVIILTLMVKGMYIM